MRRKAGALVALELAILDAAVTLSTLGKSEFHGYQLAKELKEHDSSARLVGHGTLYKALDRLQSGGLLESSWEDANEAANANRPRRRLYRITADGAAALERNRIEVVSTGRLQREASAG